MEVAVGRIVVGVVSGVLGEPLVEEPSGYFGVTVGD